MPRNDILVKMPPGGGVLFGVLPVLSSLQQSCPERIIVLRGNHEEMLLEWLDTYTGRSWRRLSFLFGMKVSPFLSHTARRLLSCQNGQDLPRGVQAPHWFPRQLSVKLPSSISG